MGLDDLKAQLHLQIEACQNKAALLAAGLAMGADLTHFESLSPSDKAAILHSMEEAEQGKLRSWEAYRKDRADKRANG
ncbi:hypothetical protein WDZ92_11070 [Nostoc sp. NIES-2111]